MLVNQAVLFTKPVHHLAINLLPEELEQQAQIYFESRGFRFVLSRTVSGPELAEQQVLRQHYLMYSQGSFGEISISDEGRQRFLQFFRLDWNQQIENDRLMSNPRLMENKGIDSAELFRLWNALYTSGKIKKIQPGVLAGWIDELDSFCINGFYPAMETNFYHPDYEMAYFVVEFDPVNFAWRHFRKQDMGTTDCSKAALDSFRGQHYAKYPVHYPARDNFVHGSAGPLEGLVERIVHETDFKLESNPVGQYLSERGISLKTFKQWKSHQTIQQLGTLFDTTEEKNTADIFQTLEAIEWSV